MDVVTVGAVVTIGFVILALIGVVGALVLVLSILGDGFKR